MSQGRPLMPPQQPRVAMKATGWVLEAKNAAGAGVSDMRQVMMALESRKALEDAEKAARQAVAQTEKAKSALSASQQNGSDIKEEEKSEKKEEPEEEEVPKCHLHRKPNKACRFCKQHLAFLDKKTAKKEAAKQELLKEIYEEPERPKIDPDSMVLLPNMTQFPKELKIRIISNRPYEMTISEYSLNDCEELLMETETGIEPDTQREDMLFIPSGWIMSVYRIMIIRPTEGEFQAYLNHENVWVRCAAYLMARIGMPQDRYWELLAPGLMDDTEFKPFPKRDPRTYTVGEYVHKLLADDKWCDEALPRVNIGLRKTLNERLAMYGQFRERYQANLQVLDRYELPGVHIEVCKDDGEWVGAKTLGAKNFSKRCVTMPVKFNDGTQQNVSIGMMITVDADAEVTDLTKSRGRSHKELFEKLRQEQKDGVVMSHKEAFKGGPGTSGLPNTWGGAGKLGKRKKTMEEEEEDEYALLEAKKKKQEREKEMSQIMQKYCAAGASSSKVTSGDVGVDAPDHMRLG